MSRILLGCFISIAIIYLLRGGRRRSVVQPTAFARMRYLIFLVLAVIGLIIILRIL